MTVTHTSKQQGITESPWKWLKFKFKCNLAGAFRFWHCGSQLSNYPAIQPTVLTLLLTGVPRRNSSLTTTNFF